jgi:hypothetical protein
MLRQRENDVWSSVSFSYVAVLKYAVNLNQYFHLFNLVKQTKFPKFPKDFKFSAQTIPEKHCVLLNEPKEKQQEPVYLCHNNTKKDAAISWSHAGKTTTLDCTHITSPYGEDR